jgi:hypothetical protein
VPGVVNADGSTPNGSLIDEIVREDARRMLTAALEAEVKPYVTELAVQRDENGRRLVVRNGCHQPRSVTTAAGTVEVKAPRVNDKRTDEATGEHKRFSSAIQPTWARKSPKISEVLPLLYLHGLSSGDFVPAREQFLGSSAGLSPATATRLTQQWQTDHTAFGERNLSPTDYVWTDGIHPRSACPSSVLRSGGHGRARGRDAVEGTALVGAGEGELIAGVVRDRRVLGELVRAADRPGGWPFGPSPSGAGAAACQRS